MTCRHGHNFRTLTQPQDVEYINCLESRHEYMATLPIRLVLSYEARTLQSEYRVRVGHVSDTPMPCQILNNHKSTCMRRV